MEDEYFECACHSDEHRLVFSYDPDDDYPDVFASMFINQYEGFFKRIWIAIKYIFGYKCKYGHFDCFMLKSKEDAGRLIHICQLYIKQMQKFEKKNTAQKGDEE